MKPSPVATLAWAGIALLAAGVGYWAGHRSAPGPDSDLSAVSARLDAVERRLEALAAPRTAATGPESSTARPAQRGTAAEGSPSPHWTPPDFPSPEELAKKRLARRAELESAFAAEPLDSGWAAAAQSRLMQAALSDTAIQSGVAPDSFDARCRSKTCRIVARFPDGADGGGWADHYILGADGMLSTSETLVQIQPDGSTEVIIFGTGD